MFKFLKKGKKISVSACLFVPRTENQIFYNFSGYVFRITSAIMLDQQYTLNCKGKILSLERPLVMGILNITPDSFYDGGKFQERSAVLAHTEQMLREGVDLIDIGGMSSRPGAEIIPTEEELRRVIPVVEMIHQRFPEAVLSVDTVRAAVAAEAIAAGAHIVNDISAGRFDERMYATVADLDVPYVLMHMQGKPADMQKEPQYQDVVQEVVDFFIEQLGKLRALGVKDVVIDPGFGFGKTLQHNYQLLKNLHVFKILGCPVLTGLSRKSMINKVLNIRPADALNGTTALHMVALQEGSRILRVHDVKEARQTIALWQMLANT